MHGYTYEATLRFNSQPLQLVPGSVTIIPPYAHLHYDYQHDGSLHWSIQFIAPSSRNEAWQIPVFLPPGKAAAMVFERLQPCVHLSPQSKAMDTRIIARLWDVLHDLAQTDGPAKATDDPRVLEAQDFIEANLAAGVNVTEVAQHCGVSTTHLNRCFQQHHGVTVGAWLRERRMSQAIHALLHSNVSISAIAASVGIPDLQHFNKAIRKEFGHSPRAIRGGADVKRVLAKTTILPDEAGPIPPGK